MENYLETQISAWPSAFTGPSYPRPLDEGTARPGPFASGRTGLFVRRQLPLWRTVLGWSLLLPFLFLASAGSLIPETGDVAFRVTGSGDGGLAHRAPLAFVLLLCCTLIARRLGAISAMTLRMKLLVALPVLALLSVSWSYSPSQSAVSACIMLIFVLFAFYLADRFDPRRQLEIILLTGAVSLPLSIALAVLAPAFGTSAGAWRGIFSHKNNCGAVSVIFLVTALHWKASSLTQRVFRAVFVLTSLFMVGMSQSRGSWLLCAVALGLTFGLWLLEKMGPKEGLVALIGAVPTAVGGLLGAQYFASLILESVGKDTTLSQRTIIWSAVWESILRRPWLGYGCAAFWNGLHGPSARVVLISGWVLSQAQDGYLDLWLQFGVGGVVILALLIAQAGLNAVRSFRRSGNGAYVRWCVIMIVCAGVYNVGESSFGLGHLTWFVFLMGCVGLSTMARVSNSKLQRDDVRFMGSMTLGG